jgi:Zn-dependent protease
MMRINEEVRDMVLSTLALGFAFMNLFFGPGIAEFLIATFVVGFSFIGHELAHRTAARAFGAAAIYRMWPLGILITILSPFFGFIFAAPGAVVIHPQRLARWGWPTIPLTSTDIGLIALSGPITNLVIGILFLFLSSVALGDLFIFGAKINFWLAFFNLLPIHPLDGGKVMAWDRKVWFIAILVALAGMIFS